MPGLAATPLSDRLRLNGTTGAGNSKDTNYLRSGYLFTALFQPSAYYTMMSDAGIQDGSNASRIDAFSRFLTVKAARAAQQRP